MTAASQVQILPLADLGAGLEPRSLCPTHANRYAETGVSETGAGSATLLHALTTCVYPESNLAQNTLEITTQIK